MWFEAKAEKPDLILALREFIRNVINDLGEQLIPYARMFYQEVLKCDIVEENGKNANHEIRSSDMERNSTFDSELLLSGIKLADIFIEGGLRTFPDFVRKMVGGMGDDIKPYLKMIYVAVRDWPGAEHDVKEMDDYVTVDNINIEDILAKSDDTISSTSKVNP